jgi:hypothetical protein
VGGLVDENSGQLINDKVAVLGPNNGDVKLFMPDGLTTNAIFRQNEGGTPQARGTYFTVAGAPIDAFKGKGAEFAKAFKPRLKGKALDPYAILGAQAADVVLRAIEKSDGSRAGVIDQVFKTTVDNGYIGSFSLNKNGDLTGAKGAALTFSVYHGTDELVSLKTMKPRTDLVAAARKEAAG